MIKGRKTWLVIFLAVLTLAWMIPYAKNEVLTARYGKGLEQTLETGFFSREDLRSYKVVAYSRTNARVYCIGEENAFGALFDLQWTDKYGWQLKEWTTVWSKTGSAAGVLWPYFWWFAL